MHHAMMLSLGLAPLSYWPENLYTYQCETALF